MIIDSTVHQEILKATLVSGDPNQRQTQLEEQRYFPTTINNKPCRARGFWWVIDSGLGPEDILYRGRTGNVDKRRAKEMHNYGTQDPWTRDLDPRF